MSYLHPLRLHFAGRFQANVSTVDNDPGHYDNARFKPDYQKVSQKNPPTDGWWNPDGDAAFRLIGCSVTAAWLADGSPAAGTDPVRQCLVADSDRKVPAKMTDLDSYQQTVSQLWGLQVRLCDAAGRTLLRGDYEPVGFMDIWDRAGSGGGDVGASAMYQSVLQNLEWGDTSQSPFLRALRAASRASGRLSIKFNVDGYNMNYGGPEFTRGRIVGTIGPAAADEPRHFVAGRQFMTLAAPGGNFFIPAGRINFCVAQVDAKRGKVYLDLGNALPTVTAGGAMSNLGALTLAWLDPAHQNAPQPIGDIAYTDADWYAQTAGVVELPAGRRLTAAELSALRQNQLAIQCTPPGGQPATAIAESPNGLFVRADQFVCRLDPGETAGVSLIATRYGQRYAGARILAMFDPSELSSFSVLFNANLAPPATPVDALAYPVRVETDRNGVASLALRARDPGNPRGFIDGQVYGVRPVLEETIFMPGGPYPFNPWNFISVLVWDRFKPDRPITWFGSLQPIFQQYANLFPVMRRFLDLADYDAVCANRRLMLLAFSLPMSDPNSMPVTRDLSGGKRKAILRWLTDVGPDGLPRKGQPRPPGKKKAAAPPRASAKGRRATPSKKPAARR